MTGCRDSHISVLDSLFLPVQAFLSDYKSFKEKIADMELRLGFVVCQAFDDCPGCESAFKVPTYIADLFRLICHIAGNFRRENFRGLLVFVMPKDTTPPNFVEKTFATKP